MLTTARKQQIVLLLVIQITVRMPNQQLSAKLIYVSIKKNNNTRSIDSPNSSKCREIIYLFSKRAMITNVLVMVENTAWVGDEDID